MVDAVNILPTLARGLVLAFALGGPLGAAAGTVVVQVSGLAAPLGHVGCALFAQAAGFPLDTAAARPLWQAADASGVTCRFDDVPAGRYAVAVFQDRNGNRRVDTNLVGQPTEAWGVSGGVRPALRAPRFEEAAFSVPAGTAEVTISIEVAR